MYDMKYQCSFSDKSFAETVNTRDMSYIFTTTCYLQGYYSSPTILGMLAGNSGADILTVISQRQYETLVSSMNELKKSNQELEKSLALNKYAHEIASRSDVRALLEGETEIENITESYEEFINRVPEAKVSNG